MSHPSAAVLSQFLTASRNPLRPLRDMPSAIDEFCTGNSDEIKEVAVLSEVRRALDETLHFNIQDILREAFRATRADMSTAEKNSSTTVIFET